MGHSILIFRMLPRNDFIIKTGTFTKSLIATVIVVDKYKGANIAAEQILFVTPFYYDKLESEISITNDPLHLPCRQCFIFRAKREK